MFKFKKNTKVIYLVFCDDVLICSFFNIKDANKSIKGKDNYRIQKNILYL